MKTLCSLPLIDRFLRTTTYTIASTTRRDLRACARLGCALEELFSRSQKTAGTVSNGATAAKRSDTSCFRRALATGSSVPRLSRTGSLYIFIYDK